MSMSHHFRRLVRKSLDLYSTSRSLARVARYNVNYGRKILNLIWQYFRHRQYRRAPWVMGPTDAMPIAVAVLTRGGGLGDLLVIAKYLRDLGEHCGDISFDVYCADLEKGAWVFQHVREVRRCYGPLAVPAATSDYDLTLEIGQYPVIDETTVHSAAVGSHARLKLVVNRLREFARLHEVEIGRRPFFDSHIAQQAVFANKTRIDYLQYVSGIPAGDGRIALTCDPGIQARLGLAETAYVTVHSGFDPNFVISGKSATKCYPHFDEVARRVKQSCPAIALVQVGARNSVRVAGCDFDLRGRTTLPEVAGLLSRAMLHVDNEGGLVHVAAQLGVRSCVIFGPTPADYFGYEGNLNIKPLSCGGCWWINDSWMDQCPRGFDVPPCMAQQPPETVADGIIGLLRAAVDSELHAR